MAKKTVRVGDKVIKLREDRQLLARFLVIQQSRPELVPKLPTTTGDYEMSVIPRSLFANDGSLLIPTDKSSITHAVEDQDDSAQSGVGSDGIPNVGVEEDQLEIEMTLGENKNVNEAAIIFDGMATLQSMKKTSSMTKISHLKLAFVKRIKTLMKGYTQGRVIFRLNTIDV